ncbi:MAG: amidohydrolase [Planctomycetota bacterium]
MILKQARSRFAVVAHVVCICQLACFFVVVVEAGNPNLMGHSNDTFVPDEVKFADTILINGNIYTNVDGQPNAEACAISGGRFIQVGDQASAERFKGQRTKVIDLNGRPVIPGLNDSHLHAVRGGRFYNLELRWDGVRSLREGLEMIREQAARTPKGQWVRVIGGWSPYQFEEKRLPTVAELNEVAPDTPVYVMFLYSVGFLNKAGCVALGITEETRPPNSQSRYVFTDGGAELYAEPNAMILYKTIGALPSMSVKDQINSTKHWYHELARFGLTSVVDAGGGGHNFPDNYIATEVLARRGEMPMRVSVYLFPQSPGKEFVDFRRWLQANSRDYNHALKTLNGYAVRGGGEYLVWAAGDFENFLSPRPDLVPDMRQQLLPVARLLLRNNWPIRQHATYDESIRQLLDVFEELDQNEIDFAGRRWAIDHAETISPDSIARVKELGGGIAIQNRMSFAGEYFLQRYGAEVTAQSPPLRKLIDSGIPLGAGTDATRVSSYNPWLSLHWMVSGKTIGGTRLYPRSNCLTREEALRLYTIGSAWFSGEDGMKGRIAPGQFADLAVLSNDYFTVDEEQIKDIESVMTLVDGRTTYATQEFSDLDPALPPVSPSWSPVAYFGGYARVSD